MINRFMCFTGVLVALAVFSFTSGCDPDRQSEARSSDKLRPTPDTLSNAQADNPIAHSLWQERLVTPGVGTDSIRLGMNQHELYDRLGKPNSKYDYDGSCRYSQIQWLPPPDGDGSVDGSGIFVFLKEEKVFEIRFGEEYSTADGISAPLSLPNLHRQVAKPLFRLTNSSNKSTNNEDLFFIVDKGKGIAYEIALEYRSKLRGLSGLYVFEPNGEFLPWGCVDKNQTLVEIIGES